MNEYVLKNKLVSAQQLLDEIFSEECRPSVRWLWNQTKAKVIPHFKIRHLIFFDVELVRMSLVQKNLVRSRGWQTVRVLQNAPQSAHITAYLCGSL